MQRITCLLLAYFVFSITSVHVFAQSELDQKIAELNVLPVVASGQDLKNAILDQLKFEKNICYKLGRLGDTQVSADEKEAIAKEFATSSDDADRVTNRVTETQKAFAEKNHFTLEKK